MPVITRLYDFSPGTTIRSAEVDAEFDQIVGLLNGTDEDNSVAIGGTIAEAPFEPKVFVKGQTILSGDADGLVLAIYKIGENTQRLGLFTSGELITAAGNQSSSVSQQTMVLGGALYTVSSNKGNVGAGEDQLGGTIDIKANTLGTAGFLGAIKVFASGNMAANANNKQLRFYVRTTVVLDSGAVAFNNVPWFLEAIIIPDTDSVSTVTVAGIFKCGATEIRVNSQVGGFDFTVDNTLKFTAEAVATNDVVLNVCQITKDAGVGVF